MLGGGIHARAVDQPHHRRTFRLAAEHVAEFRHLVPKLVQADTDEIGEHQFCHRALARQRRACRRADDRAFRNRRIDDAIPAEFREQARGRAPDAADGLLAACRAGTANDILAQDDDAAIPLHFRHQRAADCLADVHDCHGSASSQYAT